jgi:hypothetical protein
MNSLPLNYLRPSTACVLAALASAALAHAQEIPAPTYDTEPSRFSIVAEAGTAGVGPAVIITANPNLTFTVGYTWLDTDYDVESDDNNYDGKLKLSNFKAIANWHPWGGVFHFSGGVFATDNQVDVTLRPKNGTTYEINGRTYTSSQISSISGSATFDDDIAPYIGLGWAKAPASSPGFAFYATLGVFFAGDASARLDARGNGVSDLTLQNDIRAEEREINDDLDDLGLYPVAQLGVQYRF